MASLQRNKSPNHMRREIDLMSVEDDPITEHIVAGNVSWGMDSV